MATAGPSAIGPPAIIPALGPAVAPVVAPVMPKPASGAPLIMIDPGHGGTNTGAASTVEGVYEKHITLSMAAALQRRLESRGFRVALTRTSDTYVTLRGRVRRANAAGADLFVSLHANAAVTRDQRGFETYILTPDALDIDARALRMEDGTPRQHTDASTALLVDDVERGLSLTDAAELALGIQTQLRRVRGTTTDRGVRQDSMHVLLGATMPAVLVEVGFIDHPIEGRELLDVRVRERICGALADAIAAHLQAATP